MDRTLRPGASLLAVAVVLVAPLARAATLEVGPGKTYAKPCDAIAAAMAGDTIEVAAGTYTDTCSIDAANITLKGVGGMPKIDVTATGPYQEKGVYVINGDGVRIENLELTGAMISDNDGANGAGLRVFGKDLTVHGCYIHDNQDGILGGAGTMTIEYNEFSHNGLGDGCNAGGCTHNLYIPNIDKLVFQYNWSHNLATDTADKGHLLKSRAQVNQILYNRITGEGGLESYCVDLPNGGLSIVLGNVIEQGPNPDNFTLLTYGEEGLSNTDKRLFVASNTFVNDATKGTFINVASGGTLTAHNNLFVGPGTLSSTGALSADNLSATDPKFVDAASYDYHLQAGSPAIDQGVDPGSADTFSLVPTEEYVQPLANVARFSDGKLDLGAFELGTKQTGTGGSGGAGSSSATTSGSGGAGEGGHTGTTASTGTDGAGGSGGSGSSGTPDAKSGCSCHAGNADPGAGGLAALALAGLLVARRRRSA